MARHGYVVRWPQIGKLGKQIDVRSDLISGHLPVCKDGQEGVGGIIGKCTAIARKKRGTRWIVGQHVSGSSVSATRLASSGA